ncbi:HAMP domain-containing sensor histidine kinase [Paenibacillus filicis]|uniref:histidine kinase n=1 Tax=Paenibacillus gyeongsangnamensis TaxID=3388067 RepID=A0ABT4QC74_9BACL|nr:HAMP domain-containing sensor histidine kinase [Paenibacillus filicis]MCZ8514466.1 HAMP domain-containing sensor histidine kinase [Paenibacillus filicis]
MTKRTRRQGWIGFLKVAGVFLLLFVYWSAAFFAGNAVYGRIGWYPGAWASQLLTSVVGFVLWGATMYIVGRMIHSRQIDFFKNLIDAVRRIAKGEFDVALDAGGQEAPFHELVDSFNHMAVELGQIEKMRQEFISNVSHEIQSPLTSISGFSRLLQSEELTSEERRHYLGIIEAESRRLSKLSDNLMKLTSLESQHHPFEPKRFRLDKQLRNLILACEPQWMEKGIDLNIDLAPGFCTGDEDLLSQVWTNLLYNAIKFTPPGGTIGVTLTFQAEAAKVEISDTGIGMSEEDQAHVFERFFKADPSRNRALGGSGLGLSIVKKIVELHQGSVEVRSRLGEGSVFIVRLP